MLNLKRNSAPAIIKFGDPGFSRKKLTHDQPDTSVRDKYKNADMSLANSLGLALHKYYPDYPWGVMASHKQGIAQILLPCFTNYSQVIHIKNIQSPGSLDRAARKAGGIFLECFKIPRSGFNLADFQAAMKMAPLRGQGPKPA